MLNLKAENKNEEVVLDWLNQNATDIHEKINAGAKTLQQCWKYIVSQARALATGNCACVEDATVFGWARNFFIDDSITVETAPITNAKPAKVSEKKEKPQKQQAEILQLSFGD